MIQRTKKQKRALRLEQLENRELFSRDAIAFAGYGSLTFSIAPDGTHVGNEINSLQSNFNQVASTSEWQIAIARAFQKWSVNSNINIGKVADNGAASGVYGPTRGDERFGDIRVTGFDYAIDTFAEAVSENSRSVGTWAGDVFFNTAVPWQDVNSIEAAALHEVGHVLGLGHSDDPASPMHMHGPSGTLELTSQDILNLQAIHGTRQPDPNEEESGNDSIARASRIKGSEEDDTVLEGFSGDQVWIQFGDLHNANDRDVYEIKTAINYSGPLAVELRTAGLSQAKLDAEITDRNGNVLSQSQMSGNFGGVSILTLNQTAPDGKYYLHVHSGVDRFWATGDYSVTIATPTRLQADADAIAEWTRNAHRWYYDSDRLKDGFSFQMISTSSQGPETDDNHTDDSLGRSIDIPLALTTETRTVYQAVGTISDLIDIDHYRVIAPKLLNGKSELVVDLESLQLGGLVPQVQLFDDRGVALSAETRVQGYGQTQLVIENVQPEQSFFIELKANAVADEFKTGSFSLNATFSFPSAKPELLISGNVSTGTGIIEREWYVARPQLLGLSLEGRTGAQPLVGNVWVSVFDDQRHLVSGLVAPLNSLRSAPGLFLEPGTYYLQIAAESISTTPADVAVRFMVDRPSQPIGPVLGGTAVQPMFLCPGSTTQYCYPDNPTPIAITQKVGPPPTVPLPPPARTQLQTSPSSWYWSNNFLPTNPSNALDVSGNGTIDPLDVLVVINAINSNGIGPVPTLPRFLGHLDVNSNGAVDPLDALVIINYLNAK